MADITQRNSGVVDDSGKLNWRGDQVNVPQGGQSIYKSSSIQLADLGSRKVVGDRVFRYARCGAGVAPGAGDLVESDAASIEGVTAGFEDASGGKVFTFYFATSNGAGTYDEGYVIAQSGTAANMGYHYRIKTQPIVATTSDAKLALYDSLVRVINTTDEYAIFANPYSNVIEQIAATKASVGVAPIAVTTNDYFWLQTWGPCAVRGGAVPVSNPFVVGVTGAVSPMVTTDAAVLKVLGHAIQLITASERGLAFIEIAP